MSTATPIAELLGISAEKHPVAFRFTFRERVFVWVAPLKDDADLLIRASLCADGTSEWTDEVVKTGPITDLWRFADFLAPTEPALDADAILSEARAAIAAQGGGK